MGATARCLSLSYDALNRSAELLERTVVDWPAHPDEIRRRFGELPGLMCARVDGAGPRKVRPRA